MQSFSPCRPPRPFQKERALIDSRDTEPAVRHSDRMPPISTTNIQHTLPTPHPKLRVAKARVPENGGLSEEVLAWIASATELGPEAVRSQLRTWIPEYAPAGNSNQA